ncbi:MAG: DUF4352 domain-containing protein [Parcubacteria group bacterium]|nr:DUF4352 domain-containing protein [Parcubacteria group bacterium]
MQNAQQPEQSIQPQPQAQPKKSNWWKWALGGCGTLIFLGIIFIAGCSLVGKKAVDEVSKELDNSGTSSTTKAGEEIKTYKAGEEVNIGNAKWKLVEAKDLGDTLKGSSSKYPSYTKDKKAKTNSKFVMVTLEIENLDTEMHSVTAPNITDDKGREFITSSDTSEWIPEDKGIFILSNLNPNVPQQFSVIYEIPKDAANLTVKVKELKFLSTEEALIELGI